jgi:hypothetical protein
MVAKYFYEAEPHWPEEPRAPDGAPNIIVIVLDDVGFAQLGCYGSDIGTPHIDALAAEGLQYTNFHTTALCSASRASLLTGRNHHRNGMGRVIELATGLQPDPFLTHRRRAHLRLFKRPAGQSRDPRAFRIHGTAESGGGQGARAGNGRSVGRGLVSHRLPVTPM